MSVMRVYSGNTSVSCVYAGPRRVWLRPDCVFVKARCDAAHGAVSGTGFYAKGASVALSASPAPGYEFRNWDDGVADPVRTVVAAGDRVFTALFARPGTGIIHYDENY